MLVAGAAKPPASGARDALALAIRDTVCRTTKTTITAQTHFHEHQCALVYADQVYFSALATEIAGYGVAAMAGEIGFG